MKGPRLGTNIRSHRELDVYKRAVESAMTVFELSKTFAKEERYSLTDQVRRSSRSVAANIAESWRKRRYLAAFVSKLSDAETEAAETQTWLEFCVRCQYLDRKAAASLYREYEGIIRTLVGMISHADDWIIRPKAVPTKVTNIP